MDKTLRNFLHDYRIFLDGTISNINQTEKVYTEAKSQINNQKLSKTLLKNLEIHQRNLIKSNEYLKKHHDRIKSVMSLYSLEDQAVINRFYDVHNSANELISQVGELLTSLNTNKEDNQNIETTI